MSVEREGGESQEDFSRSRQSSEPVLLFSSFLKAKGGWSLAELESS